jgi:hypothetical protein
MLKPLFSLLLICCVLAACGGGGSSSPPPAPLDSDGDTIADAQDCAPMDGARWRTLTFSSVDGDGDTRRVNTTGQQCSGASLPATYFADPVAAADVDCDDAAATRWRMLPYAARDADLDNFSIPLTGEQCSGDALPAGYAATVPPQAQSAPDCDDSAASAWRYMMTFTDADGDGVGAGAGQTRCVGSSAPAGFSIYGYDPLDDANDPTAASVFNYELAPWLLSTP